MEWNQFSQRRGKGFGQILFIEEKKHWIFVYRKGGSNLNICYSLRNNGKQDYPENTVRVICRIACCIDSALKVNCLQVQQQSNSIDCGVFAVAFAVDVCFGLPLNESCYEVIEMRSHLSTCLIIQELSPRVPRCRLFQRYIDIFCVCRQNFFMSDTKDSVHNFMAKCSICYEWFNKKCMSISKKVFSSEDEHKKWKCINLLIVKFITKHFIFEIYLYFFRHT